MKNITPISPAEAAEIEALQAANVARLGMPIVVKSPVSVARVDSTPAWHAEAITLLETNFEKIDQAFIDGTKRAVWMGMFLSHIKDKGKADGSIKHGEFGPWIEKHLPHVNWRKAQRYMEIAEGVCKTGDFQIRQFDAFAHSGELPPAIEAMVEGKTQTQLLLEFKDTSPKKDKAPAKKLTPSQQLAEEIKNIEACFESAAVALEIVIALDPQKFVHPHPADRARLAGVCRKYLELEKQYKGSQTTPRTPRPAPQA